MKMKFFSAGIWVIALLVVSAHAHASEIAGTVLDEQGNPITAVHIAVEDLAGNIAGEADPGPQGQYSIAGLATGTYRVTLIPLTAQFQRQTAQSSVGPDGACLNWTLSPGVPALASARLGAAAGTCTPAPVVGGLAPGQTAAIAVGAGGVVVGSVVGILAGVGGFGDDEGPPASPAQ